jgi:tRNA-splicing ligase RtcB
MNIYGSHDDRTLQRLQRCVAAETGAIGVLGADGADEAPQVYRSRRAVLDAHAATIEVVHTLTPRIVVMAGSHELDPYRD